MNAGVVKEEGAPLKELKAIRKREGVSSCYIHYFSSLILDNKLVVVCYSAVFSAGCVIGREKSCLVVNLLCDGRLS